MNLIEKARLTQSECVSHFGYYLSSPKGAECLVSVAEAQQARDWWTVVDWLREQRRTKYFLLNVAIIEQLELLLKEAGMDRPE